MADSSKLSDELWYATGRYEDAKIGHRNAVVDRENAEILLNHALAVERSVKARVRTEGRILNPELRDDIDEAAEQVATLKLSLETAKSSEAKALQELNAVRIAWNDACFRYHRHRAHEKS